MGTPYMLQPFVPLLPFIAPSIYTDTERTMGRTVKTCIRRRRRLSKPSFLSFEDFHIGLNKTIPQEAPKNSTRIRHALPPSTKSTPPKPLQQNVGHGMEPPYISVDLSIAEQQNHATQTKPFPRNQTQLCLDPGRRRRSLPTRTTVLRENLAPPAPPHVHRPLQSGDEVL